MAALPPQPVLCYHRRERHRKELVARAIYSTARGKGAVPGLNCAAIPEQLLEMEVFRHEKGAFTGADRVASVGSNSATDAWFLDEIGDMPPASRQDLRVRRSRRSSESWHETVRRTCA